LKIRVRDWEIQQLMLEDANRWGAGWMVSNERYYQRRAAEELRAAARAITPEARERRRALAELFAGKAAQCRTGAQVGGSGPRLASVPEFQALAW
jgi:hypothetical protein